LTSSVVGFYKSVEFKENRRNLSEFDALFMRGNLPVDPIFFNFLDAIKEGKGKGRRLVTSN
jgi:hypothetical protein